MDSACEFPKLRDEQRVMFWRNVGRYVSSLPIPEVINERIAVRHHIERKEIDQQVVFTEQVNQLGCLRLIEGAAFYLDLLLWPGVTQTQELIEKLGLRRRGD